MQKRKVIGFDRKVDREWLDAVLDRVATGADLAAIRAFLHDTLSRQFPGADARRNTVSKLIRIWVLPEAAHHEQRDAAVAMVAAIRSQDRLWLHWGMTVLTYPLFRDTASAIGRLLKLQGDFTLAQLNRRLIEAWGDRSTLKRAVQRVVRSMVQWGTLLDAGKGRFTAAPKRSTPSTEVQLWLLEALHLAEESDEIEWKQMSSLPTAFPFQITAGLGDLRRSEQFTIHRQGLDMDMVAVRSRSPRGEVLRLA